MGLITGIKNFIRSRQLYFFRGTFWTQRVLRWDEGTRMRILLKDRFHNINMDDFSLLNSIDDMYASGQLMEAIDIMLIPIFGFGLWNRFIMLIYGYKKNEKARLLDLQQTARIVTDFFYVNASWTSTYISFASNLNLTSIAEIPIIKGLFSLKNPLYRSPMDESTKPEK